MKKFKKLTAGLLGAVMALSVCSFTALAAEPVETEAELKNAVENDGVIELGKSIELTDVLTIENGKDITIDLNGYTLKSASNKCAIQFGQFDKGEESTAASCTYENDGRLEIVNGNIGGYRGVLNYFGEVILGEGLKINVTDRVATSYGGEITVDGADLKATGKDGCGVVLFNSFYAFFSGEDSGANENNEKNNSAKFVMESGSIDVPSEAITGNNLLSAGTEIVINGGEIKASADGTAIYMPMEGTLDISDGYIEGGTGIEAKMGTITVSGDAKIVGTGALVESEPANGGSSPEGSALLLSAQMYGKIDGQCKNSNELTVNIKGGTFTSKDGNAVTVYNTEKQTDDGAQEAEITVTGGEISGENSAIKYISPNENEADVTVDGEKYTTEKSKTTLTVSGDVAPAAISAEGKTVFYTDVNDAVKEANKADSDTEIAVFGEAKISTDVELKENVKLVVAPGAELKADVSATDSGKAVVTETDSNGNTIYNVVDIPATPEENYEAFISNNGKVSYFDSLESAVKTVQDGQTIELLKNCDGKVEVTREVEFSVDDNGYDYRIVAGDGYENIGKDNDYEFITEEDYLDSKRPTHSYELEEGRVDRDDEDKEEPVVTTEPEEEAGPFSDVGKDNPNYDAIIKVYENGWMEGIGDGVFAPNGTLTRAMGAMVLWNKAGNPEPQNVAPFLDVTSDDWYAKAVAWAYEQGIVAGYGDVFGPDDALTTEQFERMSAIANGKTPEIYVGGAPNATRGWVASLLAM